MSETALIGSYFWGKRDSRTGEERLREEWIEIKVPAIVPRELFDLAQRVREERDPIRHPGRTTSSPLLLSGLMRCGRCGAAYELETSQKANASGIHEYRYANCRAHRRIGSHACAGFRMRLDVLEAAVKEHVAEKMFTPRRCEAMVREAIDGQGSLKAKTEEHRRQVERQLAEIERRLLSYQEAFETGALVAAELADRNRELTAKRNELQATLAKVVPIRTLPSNLPRPVDRFREGLRSLFITGDERLARRYLRTLLEEVIVYEDRLRLVARADVAIAMMADGGELDSPEERPGLSRTDVRSWLQLLDSNQRPGG